ncbi:MAG: hypothetical protein KF760_08195 [Candidatus Eremiobacteraeota bacterium]|nr:hypothetical protein [Candidatus Eremiobacteraeota bacterium]MCW5871512.1 hypothetical protein [Candidatus Eremiobacteraeota bacterium]
MNLLFWVGAGLSQASGVPNPPACDRRRFLLNQAEYRLELVRWREQVLACQPNRGHEILQKLQQHHPNIRIVTLNQDRLLQRAGCRVLELHGNGFEEGKLIWTGEELDTQVLEQVFAWLEECDTLVLLGTSSTVQPACEMPLRARGRARLIEINPEVTPLSTHCEECWRGRAEELLERFLGFPA